MYLNEYDLLATDKKISLFVIICKGKALHFGE